MQTTNFATQTMEKKMEEMYLILKNIQINQQNEIATIQKNHATTMKKVSKLQEYNQIADMTNQIFEIRIANIEEAIKQLNSALIEANKHNKK